MKYAPAAVAAALLLTAVPALAAPPAGRTDVSITVRTSDLDLTTPRGVERLRTRVDRAIEEVCSPADQTGGSISPDLQCRREFAANAAPALERLTLRAQSGATAQ